MKRNTFERLKKLGIDFDDDFEDLMVKPLEKQSEKIEEKKEEVDRYDFLPIVKINNSEDAKNAIISIKENETYKKDKIDLGVDYDKDKKEYLVADIVITQNSTARIPLMVKRGYDPLGLQDDDGVLSFECSNSGVKLKFIDREDIDYKNGEKEYDLNKAANGDVFVMEVAPSNLKRGTQFTITVYASDNDDWTGNKSLRRGICGKFNLKVVEQDVFFTNEQEKLINELKYIQDFADQSLPPEYDENYCMQAAERGLSELLDNTVDFYSVYRGTHKHKNNIGFSGKTVYDRGNYFVKKGYVERVHVFDKYIIDHKKRRSIMEADNEGEARKNYKKVMFDIIELSALDNATLLNFFEKDTNKKIGHHIYYLTVTNGFHTLILVINNYEPTNPTYEIWDQHGITSSSGSLSNIAEGIRKQTSWTFANTCLNRYISVNTKYYDSTETKLWKIRRK